MGNVSSKEETESAVLSCPMKRRSSSGLGTTEVRVNIYHIAPPGVLDSLGLGLFHSGIEVYGKEWSYGGTSEDATGIFWLAPRTATPEFKEAIKLGEITLSRSEVSKVLDEMRPMWRGLDYNLLNKNCNHFSETFAARLGLEIPEWVNRAARLGDLLLPDVAIEFIMEKYLQPHTTMECAEDDYSHIPDNLEALTIRELKTIMYVHSIDWRPCVEKQDMVDRIMQHQASSQCRLTSRPLDR